VVQCELLGPKHDVVNCLHTQHAAVVLVSHLILTGHAGRQAGRQAGKADRQGVRLAGLQVGCRRQTCEQARTHVEEVERMQGRMHKQILWSISSLKRKENCCSPCTSQTGPCSTPQLSPAAKAVPAAALRPCQARVWGSRVASACGTS
jgi:hypothetical protein